MVTIDKKSGAVLKTSMGDVTLQFMPDKAPNTCLNFVKLAHRGFYDGLTFHRVVQGFMAQGGCPKGDGTGGPGYTIRPEFTDTPHVRGTVSMARSNDPNSAGSQFFICLADARYLDSRYAAFASVVDGDEVLDRIGGVLVGENRVKELSQPRDPIYINSILLKAVSGLDELDAPPAAAPQAASDDAPQAEEEAPAPRARGSARRPRAETSGKAAPDEDVAPQKADDAGEETPAPARRRRTRRAKAPQEDKQKED